MKFLFYVIFFYEKYIKVYDQTIFLLLPSIICGPHSIIKQHKIELRSIQNGFGYQSDIIACTHNLKNLKHLLHKEGNYYQNP